ncbi:hypothetical protein TMUPMC115_2558 [Tetragenococcus muriaticus PMC-11-5]|uniref:Uncharacterized protein n=1 Tax=Tetragenococcus muriaticus PMC-11-5 TaxID=1302649 RepID=A0A091BU26_9ENTE|nr:hypothetical protein TMUPMC115_2558 [Tetragenococcus muriaticus PMC-11-5]
MELIQGSNIFSVFFDKVLKAAVNPCRALISSIVTLGPGKR